MLGEYGNVPLVEGSSGGIPPTPERHEKLGQLSLMPVAKLPEKKEAPTEPDSPEYS